MICTTHDDYVESIQDRGTAIWVVQLSDGATVFMDDCRPEMEEPSAWIRLGEHMSQTPDLRINKFYLKFRSNVQSHLPEDAEGYFFRKCLLGASGLKKNLWFYLIGHLTNERIMVQKWKVPELRLVENQTREIPEGPSLIRNPTNGGETAIIGLGDQASGCKVPC